MNKEPPFPLPFLCLSFPTCPMALTPFGPTPPAPGETLVKGKSGLLLNNAGPEVPPPPTPPHPSPPPTPPLAARQHPLEELAH